MHGIRYTEEMREFILENYKGIYAKDLAARFNARFGTDVTAEQMKSYKCNHKLNSGLDGRFQKGNIPNNKGKKISPEVYEKVKPTMFHKGHIPANHKPVGSERINKYGYVEIKVEEPKKWRLKHNVIWEQERGKIPKGAVIIFLDGDKQNLDMRNLKMIHRSELLIMNRQHMCTDNAELTEAGANLAKLMRVIKRAKEQQE